jgi:hypothetical protein
VKSHRVVGTTEMLRKEESSAASPTAVHYMRRDAKAVALVVRPSHAAIATGRARENWQSAPWLVPPFSSQLALSTFSPFRRILLHPHDIPFFTQQTLCSSPPSLIPSLSSSVWLLLHLRRRAACARAPSPLVRALSALLTVRGYVCLCRPFSEVSLPQSLPTTHRATLSCLHTSRPTTSSLSPKLCLRTTLALTVKTRRMDALLSSLNGWSRPPPTAWSSPK